MATLISDIQLQLDEVGGPVFWTIEQVYDAANDAQLEVWTNLKDWQQTSTNIVLSSGTRIIPWTNTTIMIPQFVIYNGVKIFPTTKALLSDWQDNWMSELPANPKAGLS